MLIRSDIAVLSGSSFPSALWRFQPPSTSGNNLSRHRSRDCHAEEGGSQKAGHYDLRTVGWDIVHRDRCRVRKWGPWCSFGDIGLFEGSLRPWR